MPIVIPAELNDRKASIAPNKGVPLKFVVIRVIPIMIAGSIRSYG